MDQRRYDSTDPNDQTKHARCDAELHLRLCAGRLPTGHLQFRWRVEHVDLLGHDGSSLEGSFGPFQLPHECGQEVAALVRAWIKSTAKKVADQEAMPGEDQEDEQLTLTDLLAE